MERQGVRLDYTGADWELWVRRRSELPVERWETIGKTRSRRTALRVWGALLLAEPRR